MIGTPSKRRHYIETYGWPAALALCAISVSGQVVSPPVVSPVRPDPAKAEAAYLAGARQLERKNLATAESEFARAAALNPSRQDYAMALALTREHRVTELVREAARARSQGKDSLSASLLAEARTLDPENPIVSQHDPVPLPAAAGIRVAGDAVSEAAKQIWKDPISSLAEPIQIKPSTASVPFKLHGDVREVVKTVANGYGLRASIDDSVAPQDLRFTLDAAPYSETMPILLRIARLFAVPLDATSILVVKDTPENRQKFERQAQETVYVPGSTNEQVMELSNIVRNVFDVRQVSVQTGTGTILIRAPERTLQAVNYVLSDLLDGGAQVVLDLRLYAVDRARTQNVGVQPPQSASAYPLAAQAQSLVSANQSTINQAIAQGLIKLTGNATTDLVTEALFLIATGLASNSLLTSIFGIAGGGLTTLGVSAPAASISLALNTSEVRELDEVQQRVGDKQTGNFRVGSRYPITTSSYSSGLSAATTSALSGISINGVSASTLASQLLGSGSSLTVPQVQFEDLGISLKTTPSVQRSGLVALHVELKIESLSGQSALGNPILASRALTSDISVAEGASAVLVSSLSSTESAALNGIPGLSDLPGFQGAADKLVERDSSELILLITPHVVRRRSNALYSPRIVFNVPAGSVD